jgi:hypothetical protein
MSRNPEKSQSRPKSTVLAKLIETKSRLTFWNCRDFLDRRDWLFFGVEIESLDRDHVETDRDPQG